MNDTENYKKIVNSIIISASNNEFDKKHIKNCVVSHIIENHGTVCYSDDWYVTLDSYRNGNCRNFNNFFGTNYDLKTLSNIEKVYMNQKFSINQSIRYVLICLAAFHNLTVDDANNIIMSNKTKVLDVNKKF